MLILIRLEGSDDDTLSFVKLNDTDNELEFLERLRQQFALDSVYDAQPVLSYAIITEDEYKKFKIARSFDHEQWSTWCEQKQHFYAKYHSIYNLFDRAEQKFESRKS